MTYASDDALTCLTCRVCTAPNQYLTPNGQCTRQSNTVCADCTDNKATSANNLGTCDTCQAGFFKVVSGNSFVCQRCTDVPCSNNFYIQCTNAQRQCTLCPGTTSGNACEIGHEPSKACPGTDTTPSECRACLKGTERPSKTLSLMCTRCAQVGFFKDRDGPENCGPCTNRPQSNSVYLSWGNSVPDNANCPWGCNAGFYRVPGSPNQCISCILTRGTFNNDPLATSCSLCTNKPANHSYYLLPKTVGGFNGTSNNCPWDCNAGYVKSSGGTSCVPCSAGMTYRDVGRNVQVEGGSNICWDCQQCVNGSRFETGACTITSDRVCTPCSTACSRNFFQSSPCTSTRNLQCTACRTTCFPGFYRQAVTCSGNTNFDAFLAACMPCLSPADCGVGKYVSRTCPGTDTTPNQCVLCSAIPVTGDCSPSQFTGGCVNFTDTRCQNFTRCAPGFYLAGESRNQDGVCQRCTNCTLLGLRTLRNCSIYDDTVCQGGSCNRSVPCSTPAALANRSTAFCDYSLGEAMAFCGVCPSGYWSDGQFCKECPRGDTCNRLGVVECKGQCGPGVQSYCQTGDLSSAYASCEQACPIPPAGTGGRWVRRGTHVRAETTCETYFQCGPGFYRVFRSTGVVECESCPVSLLPSRGLLDRWQTEGLSVGDRASCLWECKVEVATLNGTRTGCNILPRRNIVTGTNPSGQWLEPLSRLSGDCPSGRTSEQGAAINVSECIACHALPTGAVWLAGSRQCDWVCSNSFGSTLIQRGGGCIVPRVACLGLRGYTRGMEGVCTPTGFPWNSAGYSKLGWAFPVVGRLDNLTGVRVSSALQDGVVLTSLGYGVGNRHSLAVDGRNGSWYVQGPLCSAVRSWVGRHEFVLGAVCNQSFLVFLNLSRSTGGLGILIGSSTPGWRDGFKSQARFESELYLAPGRNGTVFVLDRWNCLLREVVVYGEPGGYLTRAYTVWGSKDRLGLPVPEPKCYGVNALAHPRRFWALRDGWVAFADDNGLWQFHTTTRELIVMVKESDGLFEADELLDVDTPDELTLRLVFDTGAVWYVYAEQAVCPLDFTSAAGGDCLVNCPWLSSSFLPARFVNRTTGACVQCNQTDCGYGEEFVACTRERDGYCRPCAARPGEAGVYMTKGTCEDVAWRTGSPPCAPGYYAAGEGRYCERCPEFTSTRFAGATDIRQCKCQEGLVLRWDRRCVAERLYEFDVACAARGACRAPPHARLVAGDSVGCRFECLEGYYHRTGAGWLDKCTPCFTDDVDFVATTRGDDDEPWSCEWH